MTLAKIKAEALSKAIGSANWLCMQKERESR